MNFQSLAALKILFNLLVAKIVLVAVALNDIGLSFMQGDNAVMADSFVGIIDNFFGKKDPLGVTLN